MKTGVCYFFFRGRITQELTLWLSVGTVKPRADLSAESWSNFSTTFDPLSIPGEIGRETANSMESSEHHLPSHPGRPALLGDTREVSIDAGRSIFESITRTCDNSTLVGFTLKTSYWMWQ